MSGLSRLEARAFVKKLALRQLAEGGAVEQIEPDDEGDDAADDEKDNADEADAA